MSAPDDPLEKPPGQALRGASPAGHPGLAPRQFQEAVRWLSACSDGSLPEMDQRDVFALALGLAGTPWKVVDVRFDAELKRLDIDLDFAPGSRFAHPDSGQPSPVYDSEPRSWRHMNFFQFQCYVNAHIPRVDGGPGVGVVSAGVKSG